MKKTDPTWEKLNTAHERTNLSVSELYRLCVSGEIESAHLVKPGKDKGIRLIKAASLDAYITSFMPGGSRYQKHPNVAAKVS
jgi:hypothetical protein